MAGRAEVFKRLTLEAALADVAHRLAPAGIGSLVLKGPHYARLLYDDPSERPFGDLDLLIEPQRFADAGAVLAAAGFVRFAPRLPGATASHHDIWYRKGEFMVIVELHRTLDLVPAATAEVWDALARDPDEIVIVGERLAVPGPAPAALLAATHAAQHRGASARTIEDLRRALSRLDDDAWRGAAAIADRLGATPALAAGLELLTAGRARAQLLGVTSEAARIVRLAPAGGPTGAVSIEKLRLQLAAAPGPAAAGWLLLRRIVPPRQLMRTRSALARRGRRGLTAAYAFRLVGVLGRVARGLPTWWAAGHGERSRSR